MKKRIISAIVMLIIIIPIIWYGKAPFKVGVGVVSLLALKELIDLKESHHDLPGLIKLTSMISLLLLVFSEFDGLSIMYGLTYRGLAILILLLLSMTLFSKEYNTQDAFYLIGCIILLGLAFNTMILVRSLNLMLFLNLILIFVLTDTFALVGGKLLGKHKLIPKVSPNKTIEGSVIGSLIGIIGACLFYHYLVNPLNFKVILAISLLSIIGQIGDLIFSKIKRENKIKDFSNLIPGHGGVLDRLDSTIAIMLGFLIFYSLFKIV